MILIRFKIYLTKSVLSFPQVILTAFYLCIRLSVLELSALLYLSPVGLTFDLFT